MSHPAGIRSSWAVGSPWTQPKPGIRAVAAPGLLSTSMVPWLLAHPNARLGAPGWSVRCGEN
jgi:hypothetical protein